MFSFSRIMALLFFVVLILDGASASASARQRHCSRKAVMTIMSACGSNDCENGNDVVQACLSQKALSNSEVMSYCCPGQM